MNKSIPGLHHTLKSKSSIYLCLPGIGIKGVYHQTLKSQRSIYLCLPRVGIKGVYHHAQLLSFFLFTLRTNFKTFVLHIFLTHCKPFRGFLPLWISLYCISLFFWSHEPKTVALTAGSRPFLSFPASWQRYQTELCSLPQLYCVSRSLPASKLQHSAHRPHSVGLPAWKSQRLPWQDSPESRHFKTAQLFSCYGWKPKSMHSVFHQHRLSVSWQDLLMSYKVLQLKLSQEASLRWECLLASSKQSRPEKLLLPRKHALLYSFPNFLRLSVDAVIHVGAICSMRAGLLGFLSFPAPQQPASSKEKLHTGLHRIINWLAH